jgi:hypothetical protein
MPRRLIATCALVLLLGSAAGPAAMAAKAKAPESWDGLSLVKAKHFDAAYLLPGADFRGYTKVMLDPTEVAFEKDWIRNYNSGSIDLSQRISDSDAKEILTAVRSGFEETFRKAFAEAGYEVVNEPAPDVLRLRTAVVNLSVAAPDRDIGRSRTYSRDAGGATVIVELRDSTSGALLGRAVDGRVAGDSARYLRNSVTNRSDFLQLFRTWAKSSLEGLTELKGQPPVATAQN